MFKILNKNIILQWFLLAVGLLFLGYQITNIQIPKEPIGFPIFFNFIYQIAQKSLIAYKIIVSFIILLTLLFIQIYYSNNKFSQKPSIIPSIVYVSVLFLTRSLTTVTPILFTNFFYYYNIGNQRLLLQI
jgi:sterol desaturase/sphingolipid hydroxylase (fatty acid hydroxylase superfamily)